MGITGSDEWHGEAISTIKGPGSRGPDAPAQDAAERHEPAATEHASHEIPEQEARREDDAGRSGIVPGPDHGRHVVASMNRLGYQLEQRVAGGDSEISPRQESAPCHGALAKTGCRYAES